MASLSNRGSLVPVAEYPSDQPRRPTKEKLAREESFAHEQNFKSQAICKAEQKALPRTLRNADSAVKKAITIAEATPPQISPDLKPLARETSTC